MALAKISSTVLRQSRGNEWTLSQSDFRKHTFSYSAVSKTMAMFVLHNVYGIEFCSFQSWFLALLSLNDVRCCQLSFLPPLFFDG